MLHAAIEPFRSGLLTMADGSQLYWEASGNPHGAPLVWLHGGPGSGLLSGGYRRIANPDDWLIIGLDQRGCGRSRPSPANRRRPISADCADSSPILRNCGST